MRYHPFRQLPLSQFHSFAGCSHCHLGSSHRALKNNPRLPSVFYYYTKWRTTQRGEMAQQRNTSNTRQCVYVRVARVFGVCAASNCEEPKWRNKTTTSNHQILCTMSRPCHHCSVNKTVSCVSVCAISKCEAPKHGMPQHPNAK